MFDNDKLQKNMMVMEYTQNRKELILHAELISACWHTLFTDIQWSQNNSQLRQYSQDSLQTISYLISFKILRHYADWLGSFSKIYAKTSLWHSVNEIGSPYDQNWFLKGQYIQYVDNCGHDSKICYEL